MQFFLSFRFSLLDFWRLLSSESAAIRRWVRVEGATHLWYSCKRKLDPPIILPPLFYIYCTFTMPPIFYIYTLLYIYNMYKSYLQHMSEQSICPAWWSRNLTSSLRCHCSVRGVLASAGVLIRKRKIANRMLIETLKKYPDWLLMSVSKSTDHNT